MKKNINKSLLLLNIVELNFERIKYFDGNYVQWHSTDLNRTCWGIWRPNSPRTTLGILILHTLT